MILIEISFLILNRIKYSYYKFEVILASLFDKQLLNIEF
jgi:hypothetical protein